MPAAHDRLDVTLHFHPLLERYLPRLAGKDRVNLSVEPGSTVDSILHEDCGLPRSVQVLVISSGRTVPLTYKVRGGDLLNVFLPFGGG